MSKTFSLTVNGQLLNFMDIRDVKARTFEIAQISAYFTRGGTEIRVTAYRYGDIIIIASTRTIANMVNRYLKEGN